MLFFKSRHLAIGVVCLGLLLTVGACSKDHSSAPVQATLYDSLGGTAMVQDPANPGTMIEKGRLGIRSVVDSTIFVIAADTAINGFFSVLLKEVTSGNTSGLMALSKNLTDFFCVGTGAKDFSYTGKNMHDAHNPSTNPRISMLVGDDDFNEFVTDLVKGAKQVGLSDQLIAQVGNVVAAQKAQVVQK
ncbi:MAG TPA: group 1 truncated hemoglobin [Puia sp.]|nr:group 1 truncated hemoglobin [Puia sp.]